MFKILVKRVIIAATYCILCFLAVESVAGQDNSNSALVGIAQNDGTAYIYHGESIPLGYGFNVYRSPDGKNWKKLTEKPFYPAHDGFDFKSRVKVDDYEYLVRMLNTNNPDRIFFIVQGTSQKAIIAGSTMPSVAKAVGRLYIDKNAPLGKEVYYKFQIVNGMGKATGTEIKGRVNLVHLTPPPPSNLAAEHEGRRVTLNWDYVPHGTRNAKYVIRFQIYYQKGDDNRLYKANIKFLARTAGDTRFQYIFKVPELGSDYTFTVRAIDFTGQASKASKPLTVTIKDNVAPSIIRGIEASLTKDYYSLITWPVSPELDLAGYHIFRAVDTSRTYTQITTQLIEPLRTAFIDSTVQPGHLYKYRVAAIDEFGNTGKKSNPRMVNIKDYRVPDAVEGFSAIYNKKTDKVALTWSGGSVVGGLRTYALYRQMIVPETGVGFLQINDAQLKLKSLIDEGVGKTNFVDGAVYRYGITVVSENGNRSDTVYVKVKIPDLTPPESPTFIEAKMNIGHRVSLLWNASASTDVVQYRVYRSGKRADTLLAALPIGQRYFRDKNVKLGRTFVYSVTAVDSLGNESLNAPIDTVFTHQPHTPDPVRNVQAVETDAGVVLAWEQATDTLVVAYKIYKSDIPTGVYEVIARTKGTRWTDTDGTAGAWYKIYPVDKLGRESRSATATQAIEGY